MVFNVGRFCLVAFAYGGFYLVAFKFKSDQQCAAVVFIFIMYRAGKFSRWDVEKFKQKRPQNIVGRFCTKATACVAVAFV